MTPEEIQTEVVRLVQAIDAVRLNSKLTDHKKAKRIAALETEIHTVRPEPATHTGKGALGS